MPTKLVLEALIPPPQSVQAAAGVFVLPANAVIRVPAEDAALVKMAEYLADRAQQQAGLALRVRPDAGASQIALRCDPALADLSAEGYRLTIDESGIVIAAPQDVGVFWGVQTLLQLFSLAGVQDGQVTLPICQIDDQPRYLWRGMMLDVARHFFSPEVVEGLIDLLALYKFNRLHLHLSDDQGWRIEIKSWPKLTTTGGSTAVDGDKGGFYTQEEYAHLVAYAQVRQITIVPEIDMPGHTNAALASYPELNCDDQAPDLYTGMEVGFSTLCVDKAVTYQFLEDVIGELAALTPGPYFHVGGDEAKSTPMEDYRRFMAEVMPIVARHGKQLVGWQEIANCPLLPGSIVQYWTHQSEMAALPPDVKLLMSPAEHAYLDMQYHAESPLGLHWAGYVSVEDSYNWNPAEYLSDIPAEQIIGVESPLWTETLRTKADIEFMSFPRLLGISEIAWASPAQGDFAAYCQRLVAHGSLLASWGINFYRAPQVPWTEDV